MKRYIKLCLLLITVCTSTFVQAQMIHVVVFCNTTDKKIGESMTVELNNVLNQFQTLHKLVEADYDLDIYELSGADCTRANLKKIIDEMDVYPEDVVWTFYGGHGSHAANNADDPWPQYLMNSGFENQANWVPMATLDNWVAAKKPRLRIISSNCCNNVQPETTIKPLWADDGRATSLKGLNAENFKKLLSAKGRVMSTSSKLGQYSWCNGYGGIYTNIFWEVMTMVGTGQVSADWDSVLKKVYEVCSAYKIRTNSYPYEYVQNPYHQVSVDGAGTTPRIRPDRRPGNPLAQALSKLVDKNIGQDSRLAMIPDVLNRHFDGGAKVITIANDMQTAVDYEDAEVFLRRICLSPYIEKVNIITESRTLLKVHEVRK